MRVKVSAAVMAAALLPGLAGCRNSEERAHQQALAAAKQKAAVTGKVQTLTYRDADGSIVTTVVEPPAPGEATNRVTVTRTK